MVRQLCAGLCCASHLRNNSNPHKLAGLWFVTAGLGTLSNPPLQPDGSSSSSSCARATTVAAFIVVILLLTCVWSPAGLIRVHAPAPLVSPRISGLGAVRHATRAPPPSSVPACRAQAASRFHPSSHRRASASPSSRGQDSRHGYSQQPLFGLCLLHDSERAPHG